MDLSGFKADQPGYKIYVPCSKIGYARHADGTVLVVVGVSYSATPVFNGRAGLVGEGERRSGEWDDVRELGWHVGGLKWLGKTREQVAVALPCASPCLLPPIQLKNRAW